MRPRSLLRLPLLALLALPLACAVADGPAVDSGAGYEAPPAPPAPDPARFGLAPAYRAFYDALEGQGDWVLIEPYGWVFRPRVNFTAWRPYQQGWWEPSEMYGWVWISTDDFGWITDHYGSWFYDDYQGWVWQPGPVWGPAWVGWVGVGDYIGWAPLAPADYPDYSRVPGNLFTFAPAQQFGTLQSNGSALFLSRPPDTKSSPMEITNIGRMGGVTFNRGPDFATVQRVGGVVAVHPEEPKVRRLKLPAITPPGESEFLLRTHRLVTAGFRNLSVLRGATTPAPAPSSTTKPPQTKPGGGSTPPDTVGTKPSHRKDAPGTPGPPRSPGDPRGRTPGAPPDSTRG
jgi:hypothetical protein